MSAVTGDQRRLLHTHLGARLVLWGEPHARLSAVTVEDFLFKFLCNLIPQPFFGLIFVQIQEFSICADVNASPDPLTCGRTCGLVAPRGLLTC